MARWGYDPRAARYRNLDTGRWVSREQVREWAGDALAANGNASQALSEMLASNALTVGDWQTMMRQSLKESYIQQYVSARGGLDMMTQADWGSIGGMLREQYRYLDRFAEDIANGRLTEAQIAARARMYFESAREAHERALERAMREADMQEVRWVLNPRAENCQRCEEFSEMGWQRVRDDPFGGALPGSGDTPCLTNCQCHLEYREGRGR